MATSSESEDESFVELGRALPFVEGDGKKKPITLQDAPKAKDSKGRPRFHGAFTGGFSAGFFNTVGSKEGWIPSTFVSSRAQRQEKDSLGQRPEDFMDEEDFGEHGIAPRKFATSSSFTSEEHGRKRRAEAVAATRDSILPVAPALVDLIVPEKIPIGIKLLRKMGWKEGQGIGPRVKRKQKKKKKQEKKTETGEDKEPAVKVYGCMLPPSQGDNQSESSDSDIDLENVTFAPKDVTPISLTSKDNVHGLGYRGLDPRAALPSTHVSLFEPPPVRSAKSRKGIRGQAFGVGALEEEDEDIYAQDSLSNYDQTMEMDDSEQLFGWTAPGARRGKGKPSQQQTPIGYVGKLLEGFTLSAKPLPQKKVFPPPTLPQGFRLFHRFKKTPQQLAQEAVGETRATKQQQPNKKLNAVERGLVLGETPIAGSVFDLIPTEDKRRMEAVKEAQRMAASRFQSAGTEQPETLPPNSGIAFEKAAADMDTTHSVQDRLQGPAGDVQTAKAPLFQGAASLQPFRKDPAKQERYERYLALVKQGVKDPYEQVASTHLTEWEKQRERDEFAKAAKIYRPLSNMMASRFTRGAFIDDSDQTSGSKESESAKSDQAKAAEMKMYGKLTHEEFEWHPHNLLCKRFNIPNPYPGSEIVGLLGSKRDKFSVFSFLSVPSDSAGQQSTTKQAEEPPKAIETSHSLTKQLAASRKKPGALSIFSVLDEKEQAPASRSAEKGSAKSTQNKEEKDDGVEEDKEKEEEQEEDKPDLDLFRAIFKNSDSESSSASEKSGDESGEDDKKSEDTDEKQMDNSSLVKKRGCDSSPVEERLTVPAKEKTEPSPASQQNSQQASCRSAVPEIPPPQPPTQEKPDSRQRSRSRWGGSIFDVLDQSPPRADQPSCKPTTEERLSTPDAQDMAADDVYGPALPPPVSTGSAVSERDTGSAPERDRHSKHKHCDKDRERSRHRHKKEKKKKSKHKKEKKKKKKSKRSHERRKKDSSGSEADSETDSSDDSS